MKKIITLDNLHCHAHAKTAEDILLNNAHFNLFKKNAFDNCVEFEFILKNKQLLYFSNFEEIFALKSLLLNKNKKTINFTKVNFEHAEIEKLALLSLLQIIKKNRYKCNHYLILRDIQKSISQEVVLRIFEKRKLFKKDYLSHINVSDSTFKRHKKLTKNSGALENKTPISPAFLRDIDNAN